MTHITQPPRIHRLKYSHGISLCFCRKRKSILLSDDSEWQHSNMINTTASVCVCGSLIQHQYHNQLITVYTATDLICYAACSCCLYTGCCQSLNKRVNAETNSRPYTPRPEKFALSFNSSSTIIPPIGWARQNATLINLKISESPLCVIRW